MINAERLNPHVRMVYNTDEHEGIMSSPGKASARKPDSSDEESSNSEFNFKKKKKVNSDKMFMTFLIGKERLD